MAVIPPRSFNSGQIVSYFRYSHFFYLPLVFWQSRFNCCEITLRPSLFFFNSWSLSMPLPTVFRMQTTRTYALVFVLWNYRLLSYLPCEIADCSRICPVKLQTDLIFALWNYRLISYLSCEITDWSHICPLKLQTALIFVLWKYRLLLIVLWNYRLLSFSSCKIAIFLKFMVLEVPTYETFLFEAASTAFHVSEPLAYGHNATGDQFVFFNSNCFYYTLRASCWRDLDHDHR